MKKLSYKEKFIQMNKEAKATWILFIILALWWGGTGLGLRNWNKSFFGLPAWAFLSTIGTWILSSLGTIFLTKYIFVDFNLEDEDEGKEDFYG